MMNFKLGDYQVNDDVVQWLTKYECQSTNGKVVGSTLIWNTQSSFSPSIHVPVSSKYIVKLIKPWTLWFGSERSIVYWIITNKFRTPIMITFTYYSKIIRNLFKCRSRHGCPSSCTRIKHSDHESWCNPSQQVPKTTYEAVACKCLIRCH